MRKKSACYMCNNALVDNDLTADNDFSAVGIGQCLGAYRIMLCSGGRLPVRIEVDVCDEKKGWYCVGSYLPRYCPNCGRKLDEYKLKRSFSRE